MGIINSNYGSSIWPSILDSSPIASSKQLYTELSYFSVLSLPIIDLAKLSTWYFATLLHHVINVMMRVSDSTWSWGSVLYSREHKYYTSNFQRYGKIIGLLWSIIHPIILSVLSLMLKLVSFMQLKSIRRFSLTAKYESNY